MLLYVDDTLVVCKSRNEIEALKQLLNSEFDMKDLGQAKKILSTDIRKDKGKGTMFFSWRKYLENVLETFRMTYCKPVMTPLVAKFKLSNLQYPKLDEDKAEMSKIPNANVVGCMMYSMVLTRLDISHALSVVSRYMVSLRKEHWKPVKWVLRYLSSTLEYGQVYGRSDGKDKRLRGFVGSEFAGDLNRRRSLTGYMYMLNGCMIN